MKKIDTCNTKANRAYRVLLRLVAAFCASLYVSFARLCARLLRVSVRVSVRVFSLTLCVYVHVCCKPLLLFPQP
jgi:hypothetical protein